MIKRKSWYNIDKAEKWWQHKKLMHLFNFLVKLTLPFLFSIFLRRYIFAQKEKNYQFVLFNIIAVQSVPTLLTSFNMLSCCKFTKLVNWSGNNHSYNSSNTTATATKTTKTTTPSANKPGTALAAIQVNSAQLSNFTAVKPAFLPTSLGGASFTNQRSGRPVGRQASKQSIHPSL